MQSDSIIRKITPAVKKYILDHDNKDLHRLLLGKQKFEGISNSEIAIQIKCREKAKRKLPSWYSCDDIVYPGVTSLEQSSSELTAKWKSENFSGGICLDLTGGLGLDSHWLGKSFSKVIYVEKEPEFVNLASHNHKKLGDQNIVHVNEEASTFLAEDENDYDLIYLDPSRRQSGSKVISLENYEPNVIHLIDDLKSRTNAILIKTSPLQDISDAIEKLHNKWRVTILVVNNECRELLFGWNKNIQHNEVRVCHLKTDQIEFLFDLEGEKRLETQISPIKKFIYEPNAGIMKSGGFKSLGKILSLPRIHKNTHLFTSDDLVSFPGRSFEVQKVIPASKKHLRHELKEMKANLTVRNFPEETENLQKRLGLNTGGSQYVFAVTDCDNNLKLILCKKASISKPAQDR